MRRFHIITLIMGVILTSCASIAPNPMAAGVQSTVAAAAGGYQFLRYVPKDYSEQNSTQYPVLIFLHGSGERGNDISKVTVHGPPRLVREGNDFPFIIISPQLPEGALWETGKLDKTLKQALSGLNVDKSRIYLTGISLGGMGTFSWAAAHPKLFAAIAPICGMANPIDANILKDVPIWAFHGEKDDVVPFQGSEFIINSINELGGTNAKITLYPDANHDSWTITYNNPELFSWLLSHSNKDGAAQLNRLR
jgi:predicted peptidase